MRCKTSKSQDAGAGLRVRELTGRAVRFYSPASELPTTWAEWNDLYARGMIGR